MYTVPSAFKPFQNNRSIGCERHIIIAISDIDYLYGTTEISGFSDGHIYGILSSLSGISQSADPLTRDFAVGGCDVVLVNAQYRTESGTWKRVSDDLEGAKGKTLSVYLMAGGLASGLSDCLKRFEGTIAETPEATLETVTIRALDPVSKWDIEIPQKIVSDHWDDAIYPYKDMRVPIVYGDFESGLDDWNTTGMAKGIPVETGIEPKFIFAGHEVNAFTECGLDFPPLVEPAMWMPADVTLSTAESHDGETWATAVGDGVGLLAYAYPTTSVDDNHYTTDTYGEHENPQNAWDKNDSTYCGIRDNTDDGTDQTSYAMFGFTTLQGAIRSDDDLMSIFRNHRNNSAAMDEMRLQFIANEASGQTPLGYLKLYYASDGSNDDSFNVDTIDASVQDGNIQTSDSLQGSPAWDWLDDKNRPLMIQFRMGDTDGADGTPDNNVLMHLHMLRLRLGVNPSEQDFQTAWAAMKGREYGSWVDDVARSNGHDEGDMIEDPAFIVESLLRDEAGLSTSDIDVASFDNCQDFVLDQRLDITEPTSIFRVIKEITEQGRFMFCFNSLGKAKAIALQDDTPTTARTIPWSHIVNDSLRLSKTDIICNQIRYNNRWQGQYGEYRDVEVRSDTTSIAAHGTVEYEVNWKHLCGQPADWQALHLVQGVSAGPPKTKGLWSNQHEVVEFSTFGFSNADLEVGDWIELDDTTVDPHILCYGSSWSGKQFLITSVVQYADKTTIRAMNRW